jgi:polyhydroxybutyrate depolymerase
VPRRLVPAVLLALLLAGVAACGGDEATTEQASASDDSVPAGGDHGRAPPAPGERAPEPSPACGTDAAAAVVPDDADLAFTSGGVERRYAQVVPTAHDGETPVPLVLNLHGLMSPYGFQRSFSLMDETAEAEGFVVLYPMGTPEGETPSWLVGADTSEVTVAYVEELVDATGEQLCIDLARVFATGLSNGGMMSSRLACDLSDRIAAVATVAGTVDFSDCDAERPVPWMAFHGTADDILPITGGVGTGLDAAGIDITRADEATGVSRDDELRPIPVALEGIAERNGCDVDPEVEQVAEHVTEQTWTGCADGADVVFYEIEGGGHSWPGGLVNPALDGVMGETTQEISANDLMWDFFVQHPLPT